MWFCSVRCGNGSRATLPAAHGGRNADPDAYPRPMFERFAGTLTRVPVRDRCVATVNGRFVRPRWNVPLVCRDSSVNWNAPGRLLRPPQGNVDARSLCRLVVPGAPNGSSIRVRVKVVDELIATGIRHPSAASLFSGPAQRSLKLRPARSPGRLRDPLHQRLQQFRCLHYCSDCYRVERTSSRAGLSPAMNHHLSRRTRLLLLTGSRAAACNGIR